MRKRFLTILCILATVSLVQGQAGQVLENPFPEIGTPKDSAIFPRGDLAVLTGVITREINRSEQGAYLFLQMDVADESGRVSNWVVRMPKVPEAALLNCRPCLITDYSPEMARLKLGMNITVTGYKASDNSRRLVLVPSTSPTNIAGVIVH
ncbi:MAG TPA: hypothetical protein VFD48_07020 [Pyrinomonadaceae bacterium]|nr:hypothetical protein [Pyrinomonadaceae bacterium]